MYSTPVNVTTSKLHLFNDFPKYCDKDNDEESIFYILMKVGIFYPNMSACNIG